MSTTRDLVSLKRLWAAVEGHIRNHHRYYRQQESIEALRRVDRQIHLGLHALVHACSGVTMDDAQLPDLQATKVASIFLQTHIRARRAAGADWPAFVSEISTQWGDLPQSCFVALTQALLWLPPEDLSERLPTLCSSLNQDQAAMLEQAVGLYLPKDQRQCLIEPDNEVITRLSQQADFAELTQTYAGLAGLWPCLTELLWLSAANDTRPHWDQFGADQPDVRFHLLALQSCSESMAAIVQGLEHPQDNAMAYSAWLCRTAVALPRAPQLSEVGGKGKHAGPLLADSQTAREWLERADSAQYSSRYQPSEGRISELDDALWFCAGGVAEHGHLIRARPSHQRAMLQSEVEAVADAG